MNTTRFRALAFMSALAFASCSGGGSGGGGAFHPIPNSPPGSGTASKATATFLIRIPASSKSSASIDEGRLRSQGMRPQYVSPSTQSLAIVVNGSGTPTVANLTPTSPNCKAASGPTPLTCSVPVAAPIGADTFTVTTYDQTNAVGNSLSTANVAATIVAGQANTVSVILNGVIASIQLILGDTSPPEGTPTTISLTVNAMDADGNVIIGPGNYNTPIALSDSDSTYTSLSATSLAAPGLSVTVNYNGGGLTSATLSASASGIPATAITNAVLTPKTLFREYPIPYAGHPYNITVGSDGNLWFTQQTGSSSGAIIAVTTGGSFHEIQAVGGIPIAIATAPSGNVWYTNQSANQIGELPSNGDGTYGANQSFGIPSASSNATGITVGPDGNLWFGEYSTNNIGRITPGGSVTEFPIGIANATPDDITSGPDGNLWFTEYLPAQIARITPGGTVTQFAQLTGSYPTGIVSGPDGNLWFTEQSGKIGRITTGGTLTEFTVPGSDPDGITNGPDGNLWFADDNGKIGQITPSGSYTEFNIPTPGGQHIGITAGPDGNIWFTEQNADKIGELLRFGPSASPPSLAFTATAQSGNVTVGEPNYSGTFTASSSNTACASVSPTSGATNFTITANGAGTCTISFTDGNNNTGTTIVQVTTTGIGIQSRHRQ